MSDDSRPANRLALASSPYLRLHAHNPVDWYPWGAEALAAARERDCPIFLSVGYSTCYWCHVMERESFSDDDTAELMNRHFVNVKLDREERPDLDEIYMSATQILTRHGGWPNSVFLTPALEPFFAGTYFPPVDRPGMPSFRTVLHSMADAWTTRRTDVGEQAASVVATIRHHLEDRPEPAAALPGTDAAERSLAGLERSFDPEWGGFGSAPKFPAPSGLLLLDEFASESERAATMLATTLDRMARGGIYDRLGGGFHRYATDREWNVPHFEKMLYDNGWLLETYARQAKRLGAAGAADAGAAAQAAATLRGVAGFLERELTAPEGAFWSALDAETDGHEGAYYVWTRDQLLDALGQEDYGFLAPIYGFDRQAFFEGSYYVLHLPVSLEAQAERRKLTVAELEGQIRPLAERLLALRAERPRPLTDDKILADWNGTAISGLAEAGRVLGEPALVDQAERAAEFVLAALRTRDGTLLHSWREGRGEVPGFLSDYAYLVRGLLALDRAAAAGASGRWLEEAARLTAEQEDRLGDPAGGFFAAAASEDLLVRSKDLFDGAMPSANAVAVLNLLELAERTGERSWREAAERALRAFGPLLERLAEPARMMALAARRAAAAGVADGADGSKPASLEHPEAAAPESSSESAEGSGPGSGPVSDQAVAFELTLAAAETAEIDQESRRGASGESSFALELAIQPGWHVYAPDPAGEAPEWVLPLRLDGVDVEVRIDELPEPRTLQVGPSEAIRILEGRVRFAGRLRTTGTEPALTVDFQACDDRRCLEPASVRLPLSEAEATPG